jgi:hypothetical protein
MTGARASRPQTSWKPKDRVEGRAMSAAFTQFLRKQAAQEEAEIRSGRPIVEEWRSAIERVFARIRGWLAETDPDGIIKITEGEIELAEGGLGRYRVPRLELRAFDRWVGSIPKARKAMGVGVFPPGKKRSLRKPPPVWPRSTTWRFSSSFQFSRRWCVLTSSRESARKPTVSPTRSCGTPRRRRCGESRRAVFFVTFWNH